MQLNRKLKRTKIVVYSLTVVPAVLLCCLIGSRLSPSFQGAPYDLYAGSMNYPPPPAQPIELENFLARAGNPDYADHLAYDLATVKYFDLINQTFNLTPPEQSLLAENGFVVIDRLAFKDFTTAYGYIYWKDLPVIVTSDSILEVMHQLYEEALIDIEQTTLAKQLTRLLAASRQQLRAKAGNNLDPDLARLYQDLDIYLTVPLHLLDPQQEEMPEATPYLQLVRAAKGTADVDLFGSRRSIDFSLFKPRGHYADGHVLAPYFQAVSWLALIDFRLLEYDPYGHPRLNPSQIAAAMMLRDTLDQANQRPTWTEIDTFFGHLVGRSDNVTLPDLDRFLADAELKTPGQAIHPPQPKRLQTLLTGRDYGRQRITGQILTVHPELSESLPRPVSFILLGQRFSIDSYIMSSLVYDRLIVDNHKVDRRLPSPLDVMYILGNDRAATHLAAELTTYNYQGNLLALRRSTADYAASFWTDSAYNRWLGAIRILNVETTGAAYPPAMRTAAWADKVLHTQLASWTQLRHNNVLYVKPSFTTGVLCDYPAGYVEPYPEFYAAIQAYALVAEELFAPYRPDIAHKSADLAAVTAQLQRLAEKQLDQDPFDADEQRFLKSIAIHKKIPVGCTFEPGWTGWYPKLFLRKEKSPALIVDVHTGPHSVLHTATGPVATMTFIVETDQGATAYVGPVLTYYEIIEEGLFPRRQTTQDWNIRLNRFTVRPPTAPPWTHSFRMPTSAALEYLAPPVLEQDVPN
jgi:hypothetical protein